MSSSTKKSLEKKLEEEEIKTGKEQIIGNTNSENGREDFGESLSYCSDVEWNRADPAYTSELINVKKKADKVTVFAGPRAKTIERTIIQTDTGPESSDKNADAIGRMASAIAHIFLSEKNIPSVNVSINLQENPNESQISIEPKKS